MARRAEGDGSARPVARRKRGEGSYEHLADGTVRYRVIRGYRPGGKRDRLEFRGPTEAACWRRYLDHLAVDRAHGQAAAQDKGCATVASWSVRLSNFPSWRNTPHRRGSRIPPDAAATPETAAARAQGRSSGGDDRLVVQLRH